MVMECARLPFQCEAFFRIGDSKDQSFSEFQTRAEAEAWCMRQYSYQGFHKAFINSELFVESII